MSRISDSFRRVQEAQQQEARLALDIVSGKRSQPCGVIARFANTNFHCTCPACLAWIDACRRCPRELAPPLPPPSNARFTWGDTEVEKYIAQLARSIDMTSHHDGDFAFRQYRQRLDSLELFRHGAENQLNARLVRVDVREPVTPHQVVRVDVREPVTPDQVANVLVRIGQFAQAYPTPFYIGLGLGLIRTINPNAALGHWRAGLYYAAIDQLRITQPDTACRLIVLRLLRILCDEEVEPSAHAQRLASELGVTLPMCQNSDTTET